MQLVKSSVQTLVSYALLWKGHEMDTLLTAIDDQLQIRHCTSHVDKYMVASGHLHQQKHAQRFGH